MVLPFDDHLFPDVAVEHTCEVLVKVARHEDGLENGATPVTLDPGDRIKSTALDGRVCNASPVRVRRRDKVIQPGVHFGFYCGAVRRADNELGSVKVVPVRQSQHIP